MSKYELGRDEANCMHDLKRASNKYMDYIIR
jgi:hypothetical protein